MERGALDLKGGAVPAFMDQVQQILPDRFRAKPLGRSVEVLGEALDCLHVGVDRLFREVAELQLLDHAFA